jgi:hypothetical protein
LFVNKYIYPFLYSCMTRTKRLKIGLLTAFAIETLCVTYCTKITGYAPFLSILYFVAGISIALFSLSFQELTPFVFKKAASTKAIYYYWIAGICILGAGMYYLSKFRMGDAPIDINNADMLPIIRVMNQRFVGGQWNHIYDPIPEIWNGIRPIYLPAMWLPFAPSIIFSFDMRWITVGGLFFAFSSFLFIFYHKKEKIFSMISLLIGCLLFCWLFSEETNGFISMTEEGVVVAYYVLLVLTLLSGNMFLIGFAISLCVLSRYSLIGWIPGFLLFLLLFKKKKQAATFSLVLGAGLLLLCVLPFGLEPLINLAKLPGKYIAFAKIVWEDSPDVFQYSLGFAKFFGQERIKSLHATLVLLTFSVPVLFIIGCYFLSKRKPIANVPLAALKISVVFFYSFIDVPYLYLFYTSSFISLLMIAPLLRQPEFPKPTD